MNHPFKHFLLNILTQDSGVASEWKPVHGDEYYKASESPGLNEQVNPLVVLTDDDPESVLYIYSPIRSSIVWETRMQRSFKRITVKLAACNNDTSLYLNSLKSTRRCQHKRREPLFIVSGDNDCEDESELCLIPKVRTFSVLK